MTTDDKIKKWLAGELSDKEKKEFESTRDYAEIKKLLVAVNNFKAPQYDREGEYEKLRTSLHEEDKTLSLYERMQPLFKIAAVLLVILTVAYFSFYRFLPLSRPAGEWISADTELILPDSSMVILNSESRIRYSEKSWAKSREVDLEGEAFFHVSEGSSFSVKTRKGTVRVLGTEFNVKDRENYYQVNCYSGSVEVDTEKQTLVLKPGMGYRIVEDKEESLTIAHEQQPDWLNAESSFKSVPVKFVFNELERQYDVEVQLKNIDPEKLFTGSFSHKNLELALKSITLPLDFNYEIKNNEIVIRVEGK